MGQERVLEFLERNPDTFYSKNEIIFGIKQKSENEITLSRSVNRSLLQLIIYNLIDAKTEGWLRFYKAKENK